MCVQPYDVPSVLTVPMRNGNIGTIPSSVSSTSVLTVPMRNGNSFPLPLTYSTSIRSYRTYEEWKHSKSIQGIQWNEESSYRTYEEWKQDGENGEVGKGNGSYRTYEEWKLNPS